MSYTSCRGCETCTDYFDGHLRYVPLKLSWLQRIRSKVRAALTGPTGFTGTTGATGAQGIRGLDGHLTWHGLAPGSLVTVHNSNGDRLWSGHLVSEDK